MEHVFVCGKCVRDGMPWRHIPVPLPGFICQLCRDALATDAYVLSERKLICAGCKARIKTREAFFCDRCYEIAVCSESCWEKVASAHASCCVSNCGEEEDAAVGAAKGSSRQSSAHRHPAVSQQKARQILHDKSVRGHPLTPKQVRLFGYLASQKKKNNNS